MNSILRRIPGGLILFTILLFSFKSLLAQDLLIPASLEQRSLHAQSIVVGKIIEQKSYEGYHNNIYTLHTVQVIAWLKNKSTLQQVSIITLGGSLNNRATVAYPSINLGIRKEYIFFLEPGNEALEDHERRLQDPSTPQMNLYAYSQGAIENRNNTYYDLLSEPPQPESAIVQKIKDIVSEEPATPQGSRFTPRTATITNGTQRTMAITSFTPNPTNAGTINPADYLKIDGTGFGAAPGDVFFPNADDGGATLVAPPQPSDYVSWSDTHIEVKVPTNGGTGNFVVNGPTAQTSPSPLVIHYSLIDIYSNFFGFAVPTRQLPHLINQNGLGGYTFTYNTNFTSNPPAVAAFERALVTWRSATGVNFRTSNTTTTAEVANDNINVVMFATVANPLPANVLGLTTSNYSGNGTGACQQQNTVWYINDIDIQFSNPPTGTTNWNFGPGLPTASQYDFESVALHELGHAHNLGHVIAPGQVMHYAIANGQTARTLSPNDIAGGQAMMSYSSSLCFTPAGVFGPMTPTTANLPVVFTNFSGRKVTPTENLLEWSTSDERNNLGFYIERSSDGQQFSSIGFITGKNQAGASYQYDDKLAGKQAWYYRIRQVDQDNRQKFTQSIRLKGQGGSLDVWSGGQNIYVQADLSIGNPVLNLYTNEGKLLLTRKITKEFTTISLPGNIKGIIGYQIFSGKQNRSGNLFVQ